MSALLALHGFTGSPRSWDFLPADPALRRLVPALVGHHGEGDTGNVVDFAGEVDRLAELAATASPVHVVGYSLGARLALGLALRHPARVSRLTLISAHPGLESAKQRSERRAADERWCELLLGRGLVPFVDAWQSQSLWATQASLAPATLERKRRERLSHDPAGLVRSLRVTGLAQMPNYREALGELRMPVTLLAGGLDSKFRDLAQQLAKSIARAELTIVDGAGHDLLLERPELVTAMIRRGNQP